MRYKYILLIIAASSLISCKKENGNPVDKPSPRIPVKHILLKDITVPHLPSPYYHFEYNTDSIVTKAGFASGYTSYDIFYKAGMISEMRNNILVNHDTLRYLYDNSGRVAIISFIDDQNVVYRHVSFNYNGSLIKEITWDHKEGNVGFLIDRTLTFEFFPDGNVKTITEHRPEINGSPATNSIRSFDQYDENINVDDFSLIHDGIHDHLFLPQGFRLQKNNPKKEWMSVDGADYYSVDYTYTYKSDSTPITKKGDLLLKRGADAGKRFQTSVFYTYY